MCLSTGINGIVSEADIVQPYTTEEDNTEFFLCHSETLVSENKTHTNHIDQNNRIQ